MAKKSRKQKFIITKEDMIKFHRAASRLVELEQGIRRIGTGAHRTSKRDAEDRKSNTVRDWDQF